MKTNTVYRANARNYYKSKHVQQTQVGGANVTILFYLILLILIALFSIYIFQFSESQNVADESLAPM